MLSRDTSAIHSYIVCTLKCICMCIVIERSRIGYVKLYKSGTVFSTLMRICGCCDSNAIMQVGTNSAVEGLVDTTEPLHSV